MRRILLGATCACLSVVSLNVNSALVGRLAETEGGADYQAYYDTDADLTWLADANYAQTSGYDADGHMSWQEANDWAAQLEVGGAIGWHLPTTLHPDPTCSNPTGDPTAGFNCTGSQMGDLFYNALGNTAGLLTRTGPFSNVQINHYNSATEYAPNTSRSWSFDMLNGNQTHASKNNIAYGWAVQSGDVAASVVPIPAAVWLFGSGLIGLIGMARRKI